MKVLMISGYKGSGKDEAASYFLYKGYKKVSFAKNLKDIVANEYDVPREFFEDQEFKEQALREYPVLSEDKFSKTIHKMLISEFRTLDNRSSENTEYYGNALKMKTIMSDGLISIREQLYWTPRALLILYGSTGRTVDVDHWVKSALNVNSDLVVVSDWRFESEYNSVVRQVGKENVMTIRINRIDNINTDQESERNLDNFEFDYVVDNRGTLPEFYNRLAQIKV